MSWLDKPGVLDKLEQKIEEKAKNKNNERFNAKTIYENIKKRVIGQDIIAKRLAKQIEDRSIVRKRGKPLATALISGPTGTGKTELAKSVAEAVFGDEKYMCRIDCGNLGSGESAMASVVGSSKVYSNSSKGILPDFLTKFNEGVILFDELEKAVTSPSAPLAQVLLSLLDEARVQTQYDMSVYSAADCIIMMTSNAKQKELGELAKTYMKDFDVNSEPTDELLNNLDDMDEAVKKVLEESFAPEFLGRIDFVSTVAPLTPKGQGELVARLFERVASDYEVEVVDVKDRFFDFLAEGSEKFGVSNVRGAKNWIEKVTGSSFTQARRDGHEKLVADWDGTKVIFEPAE